MSEQQGGRLDAEKRPGIDAPVMDGAAGRHAGGAPVAPRRKLRIALFSLCGGLALLSLLETTLALTGPARAPSEADWAEAAREVRAGFRPGDLVVFAPAWTDPIGRYHLGDLIPPEMAARADDARYARIWEVSIRGAHAPEALDDHAVAERSARHGRVHVTLYRRRGIAPPVFDFTDHLADAHVAQMPGGQPGGNPCPAQPAGTFHCTSTKVERRILEIDYQPRRGVLVPVDGRLSTNVAWDEVPVGDRLVGYAGLHDYYARKSGDGLVLLRVFVDGERVLERSVRNADGWQRFEVETGRFRPRGRVSVRFEISSAAPAWRNLGFHAEVRNVPTEEPVR